MSTWKLRDIANYAQDNPWPPGDSPEIGMRAILGAYRPPSQSGAGGKWGLAKVNQSRAKGSWPFIPPQIARAEESFVATNESGPYGDIQTYVVPRNGTMQVLAEGAQGGSVGGIAGGLGARAEASDVQVLEGQVIEVLVGQVGLAAVDGAGGGGGTYVVLDGELVVAAGGGGGANSYANASGVPGQAVPEGTDATAVNNTYGLAAPGPGGGAAGGYGGVDGYGGGGALASGGAGWLGAGGAGDHQAGAPQAFGDGGEGGISNNSSGTPHGGFGGGGAGSPSNGYGGGGGGYSGGGGGSWQPAGAGGGGGSYGSSLTEGVREGAGRALVTIEFTVEPRWEPPVIDPVTFEATSVGRLGTIQTYVVTETWTYDIEAIGAQGGNSNAHNGAGGGVGGRGARMKGRFTLYEGDVIKILVGQQATSENSTTRAAGGGGGTFVVRENEGQEPEPLIVAGGGGGGHTLDGPAAQITNDGTTDGGSNAASGAGFAGDGVGDTWTDAAQSYLNGGAGGGVGAYGNEGGFGGGANTHGYDGTTHPGGGGYSGGNSGTDPALAATSFNAGTHQDNAVSSRDGSGIVTITPVF